MTRPGPYRRKQPGSWQSRWQARDRGTGEIVSDSNTPSAAICVARRRAAEHGSRHDVLRDGRIYRVFRPPNAASTIVLNVIARVLRALLRRIE